MCAFRPDFLSTESLFPQTETHLPGLATRWHTVAGWWLGRFLAVVGVVFGLGGMASPAMGRTSVPASRVVAGSNLRQIGQSSLIYASEHQDKLPGAAATDVWDYARLAAFHGGLNDATTWAGSNDPATYEQQGALSTVLTKDGKGLDPEFRKLKPTWAVALGELHAKLPSTVPIAWTRGLQSDGTWAPHSPNGTEGGHVVFLGGNVMFYRNTLDAFTRFDGKGPCSDIRDALPPGAKIAQYEPNAEEAAAWARAERRRQVQNQVKSCILPILWLGLGTGLLKQALRQRWPFSWFVWYLVISLLAAIIMPSW